MAALGLEPGSQVETTATGTGQPSELKLLQNLLHGPEYPVFPAHTYTISGKVSQPQKNVERSAGTQGNRHPRDGECRADRGLAEDSLLS